MLLSLYLIQDNEGRREELGGEFGICIDIYPSLCAAECGLSSQLDIAASTVLLAEA